MTPLSMQWRPQLWLLTPRHSQRLTLRHLIQLLVELRQLCALSHDLAPHEEGRRHRGGARSIGAVQGQLNQGLVQQHALILEEVAAAACRQREGLGLGALVCAGRADSLL